MATGIGTLKNLKILSLARNQIKGFAGLEALGDTLEELWISHNPIEKMKGINAMRNLRVLYMSWNLIREWSEFNKLQELGNLRDLLFVGNPLYERLEIVVGNLLQAFYSYMGNSVCLRPWKLSMLVFVSVTPGIMLSPKNASPAKSFAVSTSWSITVNNTIASGLRHCSTLTELRTEICRVDGEICENIQMKKSM
ncbi:Dynein light chain 1, axonemal [Melipona quadrifasciata]|uniref:Dynein light chain 1, axonemal n=1 Tax=Melipona quadrifasciata TaxID=166423 RepID=A0A0N0BE33_9HYME|nr:Dynein light chain 1, axonemal [Melipona quadrifasciata]